MPLRARQAFRQRVQQSAIIDDKRYNVDVGSSKRMAIGRLWRCFSHTSPTTAAFSNTAACRLLCRKGAPYD